MAYTVYLAGPDVFLPDAAKIGARKQALCREYGIEGLFPLDTDAAADGDAAGIFRANVNLLRRADAGLFNLTPFRSPSADPGTVWELGFMYALGKPVFGYSGVRGDFADRVAPDGYAVERFGLPDNLMVAEAVRQSSGAFVTGSKQDSVAAIAAFEACLVRLDAARAR